MPTISCPHCGNPVEVLAEFAARRVACPHCGTAFGGGAPPKPPASLAVAPPMPAAVPDPEEHVNRVRRAFAAIRRRTRWRPSDGRLDAGALLATAGYVIGVPALFAGPWASPLVLGGAGAAFCLFGIFLARDKLVPLLGVMVCGGCAIGGRLLTPFVAQMAKDIGRSIG